MADEEKNETEEGAEQPKKPAQSKSAKTDLSKSIDAARQKKMTAAAAEMNGDAITVQAAE